MTERNRFYLTGVSPLRLCAFACFFLSITIAAAHPDSLLNINLNYKLALSSSYNTFSNWSAGTHDNFSFQGNADLDYSARRKTFRRQCSFHSALNYVKYVDSLWVKAADYWKITLRFTDQPDRRFTHSWSLLLATQWLDSYRYVRHNDVLVKEKRGGFGNPGNATLAYGLNWRFWKTSSINFSFASVKIMTKPRYAYVVPPGEEFAKTKNAYILSEYGMSFQVCIDKYLAGNILWENNSAFFANGIGKNRVQGDFINAICFRFLRFLEFRVDTQVTYDPAYSYKLQFMHGFRVGMLFDVKNGKLNK